jgi:hypothetical protein
MGAFHYEVCRFNETCPCITEDCAFTSYLPFSRLAVNGGARNNKIIATYGWWSKDITGYILQRIEY